MESADFHQDSPWRRFTSEIFPPKRCSIDRTSGSRSNCARNSCVPLAARDAVASPLLETSIDGARGILFNITGGTDLTLHEVNEAAEIVRAAADKDANIIFGTVIDEKMSGEIKITVVATGFVTGAETSREIDEQYSRPAPVEEVPAYKGFDPSNLDIPAFLRGRR